MFKVNNKDTRTTPMFCVALVSLLLTLNILHTLFSVSIVNFEQVTASWEPPDYILVNISCSKDDEKHNNYNDY